MNEYDKKNGEQMAVISTSLHYIEDKVKEISGQMLARFAVFENGYLRRDEAGRIIDGFHTEIKNIYGEITTVEKKIDTISQKLDAASKQSTKQAVSLALIMGGIGVVAFLLGKGLIRGL